MGDIMGFIGGLLILFISGSLAYGAWRGALRGIMAETTRRHWVYFPLAILLTVMAFRATMFCLDLINIYIVSNLIVFD